MSTVVNLNKARKQRDRAAAKTLAASNRAVHGLSKVEREAARRDRERAERTIDSHKRED